MLRRRFIMFILSTFRWIFAKAKLWLNVKAVLGSAPARILQAVRGITNERVADMQTCPAQELTADNDIKAAVRAGTGSADGEEITASRTVWASVKSALVAYNRAAARYVKYILMPHTAEALSADGVTAESHTAQRTGKAGKAIRGAGLLAKIRNSFTNTHSANGTFASGEELTFERLTAAEVTAAAAGADGAVVNVASEPVTAHSVKMAYWIDPVLEDGVLTIRSVYGATQTGDELEVI